MATARHACGVPPAATYPLYSGLLSALDAGKPEPLLNELMRFGFVREARRANSRALPSRYRP